MRLYFFMFLVCDNSPSQFATSLFVQMYSFPHYKHYGVDTIRNCIAMYKCVLRAFHAGHDLTMARCSTRPHFSQNTHSNLQLPIVYSYIARPTSMCIAANSHERVSKALHTSKCRILVLVRMGWKIWSTYKYLFNCELAWKKIKV